MKFVPAVQTALSPPLEKRSLGLALQLVVDVPVDGWLFNVDAKKVNLGVDVSASATKAGDFKFDPVLFSVGLGQGF